MRISDWSSDVCSSDLVPGVEWPRDRPQHGRRVAQIEVQVLRQFQGQDVVRVIDQDGVVARRRRRPAAAEPGLQSIEVLCLAGGEAGIGRNLARSGEGAGRAVGELALGEQKIGRASCRERVCQSVAMSGVPGSIKKKKKK